MPSKILTKENLTATGLIGGGIATIWRGITWVLAIKSDVETSKKDILELKRVTDAADISRKELHIKVNDQSERMVRMETKMDFVVQNIEKITTLTTK